MPNAPLTNGLEPSESFSVRELLDASPALISLIDTKEWVVKFQNGSGRACLGDLVGKSCFRHIAQLPERCPFCKATEALDTGNATSSEVPMPGGRWLLVQWAPIRSGETIYAVETITDITESKQREEEYRRLKEQFEEMAAMDTLTGLLNRRGWIQLAGRMWRRAAQARQAISVLMIDIDHFKAINDRWGHAVGDAALRHTSKLLRENVRPTDLLGRWGGEEFVVLLQGGTADARAISERLREIVSTHPTVPAYGEQPFPMTISIGGISSIPPEGTIEELESAIGQADERLYEAKQTGRNRVVI